MKRSTRYILALLLVSLSANAQFIQVDNTYTAQELVDALMANSCTQVSNVTVNGAPSGGRSYGYFSAGSSGFPFTGGVLLSSGAASSAPGPNAGILSDGDMDTWTGDDDLEAALDVSNTYNATVLEFDFVPTTTNVSFDYIFASEEYLENAPAGWCNYSDGFAFLIRPVGSTDPYQNLAVVPNTNIPIKVTSVRGPGTCPAENEQYFGSYNNFPSPINFNGQTVILTATTTVTAGIAYHIKLVIADQDDNQYDSAIFLGEGSFNIGTNLGDDRLLAAGNPLCAGESLVLDGTLGGATTYQWFKNGTAITGAVSALYTVTSAGEYRIDSTLPGGCISTGTIIVEYALVPNAAAVATYQCDDDTDGITDYYFSQISAQVSARPENYTVLSYHTTQADAAADINPIVTTTPDAPYRNTVAGEVIYARAQNIYGCAFTIPIALTVPVPVAATWTLEGLCDEDGTDDGFTQFNLTTIATNIQATYPTTASVNFYASYNEALKLGVTLPASYTNTVALAETIYARLDDAAGCNAVIEVPLRVYSFGAALAPEEAFVCDGHDLTFDAGSGYAGYSWDTTPAQNTQLLTVTQAGTYTVTLTTAEGCTGTKTFTAVRSGSATGATYEIDDFRGSTNAITITAQGSGIYQYSLDGATYQDSPQFDNLTAGLYTFYIKDINGCGPVYSRPFYILDYPKFFTPNNDGYKDTWRIPYMSTRPAIGVTVFDRFGKLITGFTGSSTGWDGTVNGRPAPAADYWFAINLENGDVVKGHFSLIR